MLPQETIEKITVEAMQKYARENGGEQGWTKDDITTGVLLAGGEEADVFRAMALGMNLCGIEGEQCGQDKKNSN